MHVRTIIPFCALLSVIHAAEDINNFSGSESPSGSPSESASTSASANLPSEPPPFLYPDPFKAHASTLPSYLPICASTDTFPAHQHILNDLLSPLPDGLAPWSDALKSFFRNQHYPGSWDGVDPHKFERPLLRMSWADVPLAVREWIEDHRESDDKESENFQAARFFAVLQNPRVEGEKVAAPKTVTEEDRAVWRDVEAEEKVVIFAPGAMYAILPLWVARGSGCEGELGDLERYSKDLKDGGVIAGVTERREVGGEGREIEFSITAQVLKKKGFEAEKDEL